jgi:hypothetical protein
MSRVSGTPLVDLLSSMSLTEINIVTSDLKSMMDQLRALRINNFETESYIGSVGRQPCRDMIFRSGYESKGPFFTEEEMYENILERWINLFEDNPMPDSSVQFTRRLYRDNSGSEIVFTNGDLDPRNILVQGGRVSGIVDWEQAGWYPEYWEYVKAMWGCTDTWDTVWPLEVVRFLRPYDYIRLLDLPIRTAFQCSRIKGTTLTSNLKNSIPAETELHPLVGFEKKIERIISANCAELILVKPKVELSVSGNKSLVAASCEL